MKPARPPSASAAELPHCLYLTADQDRLWLTTYFPSLTPPPSLSSWHEKCLELFHSQFSYCNLCLPPSLTMQNKANNRPSLALGVVMERHWTQLQCQTKDKSWPVKRCQRSRNPVDLMYTSTRLCIIGFELSYTCLLHPGVIHCLGYLQMFQNKNRKITWDVHSWCHGTQKQNGLPSVLEKLWVMMGWACFLFFFFFFFSGTLCECCMFFSQSPRSQNEAWSLLSLSAYLFIRSASGIWINGKVFSVARCAWHLDGAASVAWVGLIGVLWFSRTCAPCLVV